MKEKYLVEISLFQEITKKKNWQTQFFLKFLCIFMRFRTFQAFFSPTKIYIFLEDEGFAPPPTLTDMSAKNVIFFERLPSVFDSFLKALMLLKLENSSTLRTFNCQGTEKKYQKYNFWWSHY